MNNYTLNYYKPKKIYNLFYLSILLLLIYLILTIYIVYKETNIYLWLTIPLVFKALFMMYIFGMGVSSKKPYIIYEEGILTIFGFLGRKTYVALKQVSFAKFIGHDLVIETDQNKVLKISLYYLNKNDRIVLENTFKDVFL